MTHPAIAGFLAAVDKIREDANLVLTEILRQAVEDMRDQYPGHVIAGISGMGSWFVAVDQVTVTYSDGSVGKRDLHFHSDVESRNADGIIESLNAFNDVWENLQTYPVIRFDVDVDGTMTSRTEW